MTSTIVQAEPVRVALAVNSLLLAVVPLGELFGLWSLTGDQLAGVTTAVLAVGNFVSAVWIRDRVTPV